MPTIPISKPFYHANEMKKITYLATICGLILLGLSSCQKEKLNGGQFTATIAQMNNDDKVTYDGQGFAWQNGDGITVYRNVASAKGLYRATLSDNNNSTRATFSFDPSVTSQNNDVTDNSQYSGKFYAVYPTEIAPVGLSTGMTNRGYIILLPNQTLIADNQNNLMLEGFPMYAECSANSRHLKFKNLCGLLKLHLQKTNTTVSAINISTEDGALNGRYSIVPTYNDNGDLTAASILEDGTITDDRKAIAIQFPAQSIANGKDFFIALPAREYHTLTITITDNTGKICTKSLNSTHTFHVGVSEWSSITLQNDDLEFEVPVIDEIPGSLSGIFSIGPNSHIVFSQGNLQYKACNATAGDLTHTTSSTAVNATNGIWRFAENQYDMAETANGDLSSHYSNSYTGWIDHFRWGTSGHNSNYPYTTAPSISTDLLTDYDWGVCNAISNGGNQPGLWRTLKSSEWEYLFNSRGDNKWTRITINVGDNIAIIGIALFPDTWELPSGITLSTYGHNSKCENNILTLAKWGQMEEAGAVFLPAAGQVNSTYSLSGYNSNARYWTATKDAHGTTNAICFYFKNGTGTTAIAYSQSLTRQNSYAVRLVHVVD